MNLLADECVATEVVARLRADGHDVEAAVAVAAHHYLDDDDFSYRELGLYLSGGVDVTMNVEDPGADAVLICDAGEGEDRVLVFRRASGMLTHPPPGQTPPELVVRAGLLGAASLY